jgi:hypothetical protein
MQTALTVIETTGTVTSPDQLHLDSPLPVATDQRVRVMVLLPTVSDPSEQDWLRAAARNPAFADLTDPEEDMYSPTDGEPFDVEE